MPYRSSKTWGHEVGLSCCFRQYRAESHCRLLHGYALAVRVEFEAEGLDDRNWVIDFGGLKGFKGWLEATFDHTLLVAEDDPKFDTLWLLHEFGLARVVPVEATGCEAFARLIFEAAKVWLVDNGYRPEQVRVINASVREHGANEASYHA